MQLDNDEVNLKTKEDFEDIARQLHEDFKSKIKPMKETREGKLKLVGIVDGVEANNYCRKLSALAEDASKHDWKGDPPIISAELRQLRIDNWLNFQKARLQKVVFDNVVITGQADFSNAVFLGEVIFVNTDFSEVVRFDNVVFHDTAGFNKSTFSHSADFTNVKFLGFADFTNANFQAEASFVGTNFQGACFNNTEFFGLTKFNRSSFEKDAKLERAYFLKYADFGKVEFRGNTSFRGVKFANCADFQDSRFFGKTFFNGVAFADLANFGDANFSSQIVFSNCEFKTTTIFTGAKFAQCPRFHDADLHQDTSFIKAKFGSMGLASIFRPILINEVMKKEIRWDSEARAYRTLKLLMSKQQAQHEATQFFAAEMRCRRRQAGMRRPVLYFSSLIYDLFSEFGQSVGRVLFVLLLVNAAFTFVYYQQGLHDSASGHARFGIVEQPNTAISAAIHSRRWDQDSPWLALSLQSLNPVAFLSPKHTWVQVYDGAIYAQGVSQSLLNLVLLILLAISLRGQFRRGAGGSD